MTRRPGGATGAALLATLIAAVAPLASVGAASTPAKGAQGDPLASPDCRRALATLNAQEAALATSVPSSGAAVAGGRHGDAAGLAAARRDAAGACLARRADPPAPTPIRPPPLAVAPLVVAPAAAPLPPAASARVAPAAPVARPAAPPYAITSCDAGGCWANDGSRLNRVGPNLWGPRGICTVQGSLLQCP